MNHGGPWRMLLAVLLTGGMTFMVVGFRPLAHAQEDAAEAPSPEALAADIAEKEASLAELKEKIRILETAQAAKEGERQKFTTAVEILENRVRQARLELDYTEISTEEVRLRIRQTEDELRGLLEKDGRIRTQLRELLRTLALLDQRSPLEVLLLHGTFADFLGNQQAVARLQARATALLTTTHDLKRARERHEEDLKGREADLENLAKLQTTQRDSLEEQEQQQRQALSQSVAEVARVAARLAEAEQARREIQLEVFTLRNTGIRLSLKQAEDFARYASGATGVRPALLLGVLKVESNIGINVGAGRYPEDVHPGHREAFLRVVSKLGLDPKTTPVSARPRTYQGWGGALGPAQILPGTWERIADEVGRLVGKEMPSPFELLDAFVGTAVLLRNAGAASGDEYEAVNRYFAGPNWQRFTWYGDRVLAVAKEYESRGL